MKQFDETAGWLKGNTHMHTTLSDGRNSPQEALAQYARAGYDFTVMTDHRMVSPETTYENMLVLSGTELDYMFPEQAVHLIGIGLLPDLIDPTALCRGEGATVEGGVAGICAADGVAVLAHPAWSLNTLAMLRRLKGISALEIYNAVSNVPWNARRADSSGYSDAASANGMYYPVICADDAHFYNGDQCNAWIMVNTADCSRTGIVAALREGRFYGTRGPQIFQIDVTNETVAVRCSAVDSIVFYSNSPWVNKRTYLETGMTQATYAFAKNDRYVRVELMDANGKCAYSAPLVRPATTD